MRGPALLAGPLAPHGVPAAKTPKAAFDAIVVAVLEDLESRWHAELGLVEFAVEETPLVPDDWDADTVPLASLVRGTGGAPTRLVPLATARIGGSRLSPAPRRHLRWRA